ncbi:hypothetical protein NMD1_02732 [Novosphingobium sp. MD-1]|nr:hypothetical protein NMD1_02732 [Novosphingobium sp. MD-1]
MIGSNGYAHGILRFRLSLEGILRPLRRIAPTMPDQTPCNALLSVFAGRPWGAPPCIASYRERIS